MSLVSMIDPSPDWIVGVSSLELCLRNCSWVESRTLNLYPWDAGTDDGVTYLVRNASITSFLFLKEYYFHSHQIYLLRHANASARSPPSTPTIQTRHFTILPAPQSNHSQDSIYPDNGSTRKPVIPQWIYPKTTQKIAKLKSGRIGRHVPLLAVGASSTSSANTKMRIVNIFVIND